MTTVPSCFPDHGFGIQTVCTAIVHFFFFFGGGGGEGKVREVYRWMMIQGTELKK